MRILFYLPVITPWWFSNIVVGTIRTLAAEHEVYIMVPPLWQGTGISRNEAPHIEALPHVHWHLLNGPGHPQLRMDASGEDDLIQFVEAIAPDLTLCRSADMKTPARFPGTVRYMMEGGAPPFQLGNQEMALKTQLFDHGFTPVMEPDVAKALDRAAQELWDDMHARLTIQPRDEFLRHARLDCSVSKGRRIIGLPLEYEHPENFFSQHHAFASNAAMVHAVAHDLPDNATLLVTHHPLTERHGDVSEVNAAIMQHGGRVKLLSRSNRDNLHGIAARDATLSMTKHCDAMVVGNSKSWSICAALGTPMVRLSSAPTADWVNAYDNVQDLIRDLDGGRARVADRAFAKRWFGYHILNAVLDPIAPDLRAQDVIARVSNPVDPSRWTQAMARYRALNPPIALSNYPVQESTYA